MGLGYLCIFKIPGSLVVPKKNQGENSRCKDRQEGGGVINTNPTAKLVCGQ